AITGVMWALPVYVLQQGGHTVGEALQPRYILPLLVLLGGVLALGSPRIPWSRRQFLLVAGALSVAHIFALHQNIRRYVTGIAGGSFNLNSGMEWWWSGLPLSPMAVWLVGSLSFAALLLVLAWRMPYPAHTTIESVRSSSM